MSNDLDMEMWDAGRDEDAKRSTEHGYRSCKTGRFTESPITMASIAKAHGVACGRRKGGGLTPEMKKSTMRLIQDANRSKNTRLRKSTVRLMKDAANRSKKPKG